MRGLRFVPILLAGAALLAGCSAQEASGAQVESGPPPVNVEAVTVEPRSFAERTWLPAEVEARESVRLSAEAMGRIAWVCCEENAQVEKGQRLARIDTAVNQAQVAQARANLELAERDLSRIEPLQGTGAATPAQIDGVRSRRDAASAAFEQALAAMKKTTVRSPITGRIARRYLTAGEIAQPGQPLFDIVNIEKVEVVAGLPERDFAYVRVGQEIAVRIDAYREQTFAGRVTRVGLVAGAARTFPLEVTVDNPEARLRPGMVGELRVTKRTYEAAVVIPQDAVIDEFESRRVYVVGADGTALEREVELGPRQGEQVVVLGGLSPGERLVVNGHRFLTDGRAIELVRTGRLDEAGRLTFDAPRAARLDAEKVGPGEG